MENFVNQSHLNMRKQIASGDLCHLENFEIVFTWQGTIYFVKYFKIEVPWSYERKWEIDPASIKQI